MSSVQRFSAKVIAIHQLTHDVRQIDFRLSEPPEIRFKAGQFVSFEVPDARTGRTVTRPYSIASAPSARTTVSLLLNFVPDGPGSTFLFKLNEGDTTNFSGPAGNFYLREDPTRDLLLVATGTGIAPIRSMLLANAERPLPSRTTVFWGLRSQHDLYYEEELSRLSRERPEHSHVITLSRPEPGWAGASGRVTTLIARQIQDVKQLAVYLCGNSGMITEVTRIIQAKGLCPIFREKYYDDASVDSDE
ncbi:MAG TPA: FAD-binding oxidoreductase [Nitrospira sp.]|nr:FAD-binding oxidoreductase [Nitrospira sp.]